MEVSWASAEAWERAARAAERGGRRATVGTICPDCMHLIPRINEHRWDIRDQMCRCGRATTTIDHDFSAHGLTSRQVSTRAARGRLYE